jgi:integrase
MATGNFTKRVTSRGTTWGTVVDLGPDPVTGKRRQRRLSAPTRRELEKMVHETLHNAQQGTHVEASKQTVREYLTDWLKTAEPTMRPASFVRYRDIITKNVLPELGGMKLSALAPARVQALYAAFGKRGLSAATIELHHMVLHRSLEQAVKWRLLASNPCDAVDVPRSTPPEMHTWDADQVRAFLTATADNDLAALWRLALLTGMRKGEILALRWSDVDLDKRVVAVRRTLTRGQNGFTYGEPKSRAGRRSIALPASCVNALRKHRTRQLERRLLAGADWQDNDLVFEGGTGEGIYPNTLLRTFNRLATRLGLPVIRFHDARHTAATLALAEGIHPKIVQERLGHSNIAMTLDRYSHVTMTMQQDAADRLDAAIGD